MKYTFIVQTPSSLPYAVDVDEKTISDGINVVMPADAGVGLFTILFAIDHEAGKVFRVIRDKNNVSVLNESAYQRVGIQTPDKYFTMPQTAEIEA